VKIRNNKYIAKVKKYPKKGIINKHGCQNYIKKKNLNEDDDNNDN